MHEPQFQELGNGWESTFLFTMLMFSNIGITSCITGWCFATSVVSFSIGNFMGISSSQLTDVHFTCRAIWDDFGVQNGAVVEVWTSLACDQWSLYVGLVVRFQSAVETIWVYRLNMTTEHRWFSQLNLHWQSFVRHFSAHVWLPKGCIMKLWI